MIEFFEDSGLIKCSQNPQLYFNMFEVMEKKKLELNEKVEFSIVPVSQACQSYFMKVNTVKNTLDRKIG